MTAPSNVEQPDILTLEFDAEELLITDLAELTNDLMSVVRNFSSPHIPKAYRVRWVVQGVSKASPLRINLAPAATYRNRPIMGRPIEELPYRLLVGIHQLLDDARRPPEFTDDILKHLKRLVERTKKSSGKMRLLAGSDAIDITSEISAHVDAILEEAYRAFGTVEGTLDAINVHGSKWMFAVYDDLTGRRMNCSFGEAVPLVEVTSAITRRVAVQGEISYRNDGEITNIHADHLSVFPSDDELPTAQDVLGIFGVVNG